MKNLNLSNSVFIILFRLSVVHVPIFGHTDQTLFADSPIQTEPSYASLKTTIWKGFMQPTHEASWAPHFRQRAGGDGKLAEECHATCTPPPPRFPRHTVCPGTPLGSPRTFYQFYPHKLFLKGFRKESLPSTHHPPAFYKEIVWEEQDCPSMTPCKKLWIRWKWRRMTGWVLVQHVPAGMQSASAAMCTHTYMANGWQIYSYLGQRISLGNPCI